ncbi:MAG: hypothetical protein ABW179_07590 [Methylobacterium sp.]
MATSPSILFDEVCARLPLFEDLPRDAPQRLAAAGFGRGLLTGAVRSRLRKAGFADMGMLALATPAELTSVRKIGPVRLQAIRAHVLDELARTYPDARVFHGTDATATRRMDRLRSMPANRLPLGETLLGALGCIGETCAALATRGRSECLRTGAVAATDLDGVVTALVDGLLQDCPRAAPPIGHDPAVDDVGERERRDETMRERDREWEEAAPRVRYRGS